MGAITLLGHPLIGVRDHGRNQRGLALSISSTRKSTEAHLEAQVRLDMFLSIITDCNVIAVIVAA